MKMMIGTSLPIVKTLLTIAACLMPSKLITASTATTKTMTAARAESTARARPEIGDVVDQEIAIRGESCDACQPDQPADLECHGRIECLASVEIWTAGVVESTADFSEAQDDQRHHERADDKRDDAVRADQRIYSGRESENSRADNAVDCDCDQVPAANATDQTFVSVVLHRGDRLYCVHDSNQSSSRPLSTFSCFHFRDGPTERRETFITGLGGPCG